jgi:hypothetical protein
VVPPLGPALLQLRLRHLPPPALLALSWQQRSTQQAPAESNTVSGSRNSSSSDGRRECWHPLAIFLEPQRQEAAAPAAAHVAGNWTQLNLATAGTTAAAGGELLLLLDPACGHALRLLVDPLAQVAALLLAHAGAAVGIAASLMLLVLSHQVAVMGRLLARKPQAVGASSSAMQCSAAQCLLGGWVGSTASICLRCPCKLVSKAGSRSGVGEGRAAPVEGCRTYHCLL